MRTTTKVGDGNNIDLSGTQLKKWVVNVSKDKLTNDQTRVLDKGLNFAVASDKLPVEEFIIATEDRDKEVEHITKAIERCEYPS